MSTTTINIEREDGVLVADKVGSGPAIVLSPGLGDIRSSYRHLAPKLVEAGYTVYSIDLRGHGDSDTTFKSYTCEDIAQDVIALLDQEDVAEATFVGNSMSAGAACWASVIAPERFKKIVLLGPFVRDTAKDKMFRPLVPILFASCWGTPFWMSFRKTLFITPPDDQPTEDKKMRGTLRNKKRLAAIRKMIRASKAQVGARLGDVKAGTLVIMGDKDPDYPSPVEEAKLICDLVGGESHFEMVTESGHYPQTTHPDRVADLILEHIEK